MEVVGAVSARRKSPRKLGVSMDGITNWQHVNHMGDALQAGTRKQKLACVSAAELYFGNATKRTASVHFWTEVSENTQWP
jgi:hypothetical protein